MKNFTIILLFIFVKLNVFGSSWFPAYPYTQKIEGQNITIKAVPYQPHDGSSTIGSTKVYLNDKLLYSINRYYREKIISSNDGQYLAIIHSPIDVIPYTNIGDSVLHVDFCRKAIEVLKNGQPFKNFKLKDVIDTSKLEIDNLLDWVYDMDSKALERYTWDYKYWSKILSRKEKKACFCDDTSYYCQRWITAKDSMEYYRHEEHIYYNSVYVKNDTLVVLTNKGTAVAFDFKTMNFKQVPIGEIMPNKQDFNPPKLIRKYEYRNVKIPDKYDFPTLKDGRKFDKAIADIFNLSIDENRTKDSLYIYIYNFLLDKKGKCIGFDGWIYNRNISNFFSDEINKTMTEKLEKWIQEQSFKTNLIPKNFEAYSFRCFVYLK